MFTLLCLALYTKDDNEIFSYLGYPLQGKVRPPYGILGNSKINPEKPLKMTRND
jgi:hypothetical protein